jgi:hypothetical protein
VKARVLDALFLPMGPLRRRCIDDVWVFGLHCSFTIVTLLIPSNPATQAQRCRPPAPPPPSVRLSYAATSGAQQTTRDRRVVTIPDDQKRPVS